MFTDIFNTFAVLLITLGVIILIYCKWAFGYWTRRDVVALHPSLPFGNTRDAVLRKRTLGEVWREAYFLLKSQGLRHGGAYFFLKPIYLPVDLKIVKSILQTDCQHFYGRGLYVNEHVDPLSANIFNLDGAKWKSIRSKVTPTFSSGQLKKMFRTLISCKSGLEDLLSSLPEEEPIDVKDVIGRYTTDVIASCGFGLECHSMQNPDSDFRKYGVRVFNMNTIAVLKQMTTLLVPHWILKMVKFRPMRQDVIDFFYNAVIDTINYREQNNIIRNDFMHNMLQLKNTGMLTDEDTISNGERKPQGTLTVNEIAAQCFIFFAAGFETSSTTVNFASFELAMSPDVQDKAREEIKGVLLKYDGAVTYEAIMEMPYLENVINETLRKYPPLQSLFRRCNKDYIVPDTNLVIKEGIQVMIPVLGIHYDPEYYLNPDKFDPDRFNEENKKSRPQMAFIPFGEGPRICIGLRFGMIQSKVALITLLMNYELTVNKKTKVPIVFSKRGFVTAAEGGIWIDLHNLQKDPDRQG